MSGVPETKGAAEGTSFEERPEQTASEAFVTDIQKLLKMRQKAPADNEERIGEIERAITSKVLRFMLYNQEVGDKTPVEWLRENNIRIGKSELRRFEDQNNDTVKGYDPLAYAIINSSAISIHKDGKTPCDSALLYATKKGYTIDGKSALQFAIDCKSTLERDLKGKLTPTYTDHRQIQLEKLVKNIPEAASHKEEMERIDRLRVKAEQTENARRIFAGAAASAGARAGAGAGLEDISSDTSIRYSPRSSGESETTRLLGSKYKNTSGTRSR